MNFLIYWASVRFLLSFNLKVSRLFNGLTEHVCRLKIQFMDKVHKVSG